jgi:hypothetical protein
METYKAALAILIDHLAVTIKNFLPTIARLRYSHAFALLGVVNNKSKEKEKVMSHSSREAVIAVFLLAVVVLACKNSQNTNSVPANNSNTTASSEKPDADDIVHSATGVEKEKPAAGKANVQGKVFFNGKPVADIEVKLCEKFSRFIGGCSGETFTTKTDAGGEYLIKSVPAGIYEGLTAKVFKTPYYVFATSGIVGSAKYKLEADQTFFAPDSNLFKSDLKLVTPRAGSKINASNIEVKWDAYPDAAYYKFSIHADSSTDAKTEYDYVNKRVDGTSYVLEKPLSPGSYTCQVEAYNSNDIKLSESADDIKFTVTGEK